MSITTKSSPVFPSKCIIPTKLILDGLKRNVSRGNSLSDELDLSSVLGDTRAYLYSPVLGLAKMSFDAILDLTAGVF